MALLQQCNTTEQFRSSYLTGGMDVRMQKSYPHPFHRSHPPYSRTTSTGEQATAVWNRFSGIALSLGEGLLFGEHGRTWKMCC